MLKDKISVWFLLCSRLRVHKNQTHLHLQSNLLFCDWRPKTLNHQPKQKSQTSRYYFGYILGVILRKNVYADLATFCDSHQTVGYSQRNQNIQASTRLVSDYNNDGIILSFLRHFLALKMCLTSQPPSHYWISLQKYYFNPPEIHLTYTQKVKQSIRKKGI